MSHWGTTDFGELIFVLLPCVVFSEIVSTIGTGQTKGRDVKPNCPQEFAMLRPIMSKKKKGRILYEKHDMKGGLTVCAGRIDYIYNICYGSKSLQSDGGKSRENERNYWEDKTVDKRARKEKSHFLPHSYF